MPINNQSKTRAQDTLIFPESDYHQIRDGLNNFGNFYEPTKFPEGLPDPLSQANFDIRSYQEIAPNKLASAKNAIIGQENRIKILRVRDQDTGSLKEVILYYKDSKLHQHTQILENPQDGMVEKVAKDLQFYIKLAESEHARGDLKSALAKLSSSLTNPKANVLDQFQELKKFTIQQLASGDQNLQAQARQINQQLSLQSDQPKNSYHQAANRIVAQKFMRSVAVRSHNEQDQDSQRFESINLADEGTKRSEVTGTGISAGYKPTTPNEVDIQRYNYKSANEADHGKPSTTEVVYIKIKKLNLDGSLLTDPSKRFNLYPDQGDEGKKICYLKVSFKDGTPTIDTKHIYASSASSKNQKIPITLATVEELANEDSRLLLSSLKQMQINIVNNEIDQGLTMSKSTISLQVGELIKQREIEERLKLNKSAIAIQAGLRGMRDRGKAKEEREAREERKASASLIASAFRSQIARKELEKKRNDATTIQAGYRGMRARKKVTEVREERKIQALREAINLAENTAATAIKAAYKSMIARKTVSEARDERKAREEREERTKEYLRKNLIAWNSVTKNKTRIQATLDKLSNQQQKSGLRTAFNAFKSNSEQSKKQKELERNQQTNMLRQTLEAWRDSSIASKTKRQQEEQSQRKRAEQQAIKDQEHEQFAAQQRANKAEATRRQQQLLEESKRYSQLPKFLQTIHGQASVETKTAIFAFDEVARNFKSSQSDISQGSEAVERSLQTLFDLVPDQADSIKRQLRNYLKNPPQDNPYQQLSKSKDQLFATTILDQTADQQGFSYSQPPQHQASAELVLGLALSDRAIVPDSLENDLGMGAGIALQDPAPLSPQPLHPQASGLSIPKPPISKDDFMKKQKEALKGESGSKARGGGSKQPKVSDTKNQKIDQLIDQIYEALPRENQSNQFDEDKIKTALGELYSIAGGVVSKRSAVEQIKSSLLSSDKYGLTEEEKNGIRNYDLQSLKSEFSKKSKSPALAASISADLGYPEQDARFAGGEGGMPMTNQAERNPSLDLGDNDSDYGSDYDSDAESIEGGNLEDFDDDSDAGSIEGGNLEGFITSQVFIHDYQDNQVNQQEKVREIEEVVELVKSIKGLQNVEDKNIQELFEKVCNLFDNSGDKNQKVQSISVIVGEITKELNDERVIGKLLELNNSYQESHGNQRGQFLRSPSPGFSDDEGDGPALSRLPSPSPGTRSTSRDRQPLSRPRNLSTDSNCIAS